MSNPSRQKGTAWETELLPRLRGLFGLQVERAPLKGTADAGDFLGVPFLIEAKSTARPLFQQWARICERKAGRAWALIWKGDRRVKTGNGPYVILPLELFELLVDCIDGTERDWTGPERVAWLRSAVAELEDVA